MQKHASPITSPCSQSHAGQTAAQAPATPRRHPAHPSLTTRQRPPYVHRHWAHAGPYGRAGMGLQRSHHSTSQAGHTRAAPSRTFPRSSAAAESGASHSSRTKALARAGQEHSVTQRVCYKPAVRPSLPLAFASLAPPLRPSPAVAQGLTATRLAGHTPALRARMELQVQTCKNHNHYHTCRPC
jgi:hypothetical protein